MNLPSTEIIRSEHRSIAAVLDGLRYFTHAIGQAPEKSAAGFRAIRAMLHYLDVFPEQFHHPKEDRYLFAAIKGATREGDTILNRLQDDHARGEERILQLMRLAIRAECEPQRYGAGLISEVDRYIDDQWVHMNTEEETVLPLARRVLHAADWSRIDAAFHGNVDPLVGVQAGKDFEALYSRIVQLTPSPIGLASD